VWIANPTVLNGLDQDQGKHERQIGSIEQHDTLAQDTWVYETLRQSWSDPGILAFRSIDSVNASPNHEHGVEAATILD
jgi:hypothetical protein